MKSLYCDSCDLHIWVEFFEYHSKRTHRMAVKYAQTHGQTVPYRWRFRFTTWNVHSSTLAFTHYLHVWIFDWVHVRFCQCVNQECQFLYETLQCMWCWLLTSIDELNVLLTIAAIMTTVPSRQGLRKWTASSVAVTQGPRASVFALRPAHTSTQLNTCIRGASLHTWQQFALYRNCTVHLVLQFKIIMCRWCQLLRWEILIWVPSSDPEYMIMNWMSWFKNVDV